MMDTFLPEKILQSKRYYNALLRENENEIRRLMDLQKNLRSMGAELDDWARFGGPYCEDILDDLYEKLRELAEEQNIEANQETAHPRVALGGRTRP